MDEEISVSDLVLERVKPREFFAYPSFWEENEIIETIRRSCENANETRRHLGKYLQIEEIVESKIPPVAISLLLSGFTNALTWVFSTVGIAFCGIYGGTIAALLILAFTGSAKRGGMYLWLYLGFPQNLLLLVGIPLIIVYLIGITASIKYDYEDFAEARKAVTIEKDKWEIELRKEAKETDRLYSDIYKLSTLGGIPLEMWFECDRIWSYFKDGRADTLKEALTILEKDLRAERFVKKEDIGEYKLKLAFLRAGHLEEKLK